MVVLDEDMKASTATGSTTTIGGNNENNARDAGRRMMNIFIPLTVGYFLAYWGQYNTMTQQIPYGTEVQKVVISKSGYTKKKVDLTSSLMEHEEIHSEVISTLRYTDDGNVNLTSPFKDPEEIHSGEISKSEFSKDNNNLTLPKMDHEEIHSVVMSKSRLTDNDNTNLTLTLVNPEEIPYIQHDDRWSMLHMGKAGGGTVGDRVRKTWKVDYHGCHPNPCNPIESKKGPIWINIRDPIDRFVSAFYWRLTVICNPNGDSRKKSEHAVAHPDLYCRGPSSKKEQEILFNKYHENINLLAESCDDLRDIRHIIHAKFNIEDWLKRFDWRENIQLLYPIVLEKNYDLNQQVDSAVDFSYNYSKFESAANYSKRKNMVWNIDEHPTTDDASMHSSKIHNANRTALSPLGEKCLRQYFQKDYELLRELQQKACKDDLCKQALESILQRRNIE